MLQLKIQQKCAPSFPLMHVESKALPEELFGPSSGDTEKESDRICASLSLHSVQDKQTGHCEVGASWEESAVSGMGRDVDRGFLAQTWGVSDGSLVLVLELKLSYKRKFTTSRMDG